MEAIKLMISEEQEEMFLKQFYQIATKAIEKAQENAGMTREYLNQKEMAEYLNVSENFLKNAVRNEGLPVVELGARKFYSKKAVNEFMFARMKRGKILEDDEVEIIKKCFKKRKKVFPKVCRLGEHSIIKC